jgi:DtxR family transcriptional regulator, Mn-dependent transcriptional regulator
VEAKLVELLGDPATCPHGNPIPGSAHRVDTGATVPLALAPVGPVRVARISEKIELDDRALRLLAAARLVPGSRASVLGSDAEGTRVRSDAGERTVPADVARLTFVVPLE